MADPTGDDIHVPVPIGKVKPVPKRRMKGASTYDDPTGGLVDSDGAEIEILMEKADPRVEYRPGPDPAGWACGGCRFYDPDDLSCSLVEGTIDPTAVCDLWTAPIAVTMSEPFQLFIETEAFGAPGEDLSKPMWIPFLPKPGVYQHATYGEIKITPQANAAMVASVKEGVYQANIPLDAEHETKLSGAVAWIKDMRMNEDGSADALVEWTPRGQTLVQSGSFKYVSPEWFKSWRDPATGVIHQNVVAGGAITTRPFFKDKVLRALVASESGATTIIGAKEDNVADPVKDKEITPVADDKKVIEDPTKAAEPVKAEPVKVEPVKATEPPAFTAAEFAAVTTRLEAAEALAASEKVAREAATSELSLIKKSNRTSRFTDIVLGRGENDGVRWFGEPEKHVALLEKMSEAFGEDSQEIKDYVEQQNAVSKSIREGGLFTEVGSSTGPGSSSPEVKLDSMAKAAVKDDPKKSYAQAYSEALQSPEGRKLYEETVKS